ncbi:related to Mitochondrial inner membrane protease subunit 2 [Saccharomycodes ludwigii]|uniref:Mitochondrial inner membrane protease subunit n=1 Tax=Saccharomycodes ludwigii TaxID=36035 RepID=A0A376BBA3_9ASCO|nr:hypothetical protein SCDLUD_004151 [Saccharomycodes ludwigii]KAH3899852.1 hypothetical protein SCDLUD_004151 [Saccharomycodes ludwigii]SSD61962.1 related to Mitochondrial inner membrane protease subunit 2 [Saccharomycodes ludwigii]
MRTNNTTTHYLKQFFKPILISITWIPVIITFNNHVCFVARIDGRSMEPTLKSGDWVFLWKWNCTDINAYKRNDVILFKAPLNSKKVYCKRIKGLQYDSVIPKNINNTTSTDAKKLVHIPRNHIWCEGDNVFHSIDSNTYGPVSTGLCVGKVTKIIWPLSRFGTDLYESQGRTNVLYKK